MNKPHAQSPIVIDGLKIGPMRQTAGGMPTLSAIMKSVQRETGLWKGVRLLAQVNQRNGFDCPGCAWPDEDGPRGPIAFCENGAKAVVEEGTNHRANPDFFRRYSVYELSEHTDYWLTKQGRLTHPMWLPPDGTHYEPITWERAFELIDAELNQLDSPDEAIFYTSGRASNEAAFLYQLFARQFGTNNLPDCSNMCHESSGVALKETLGVGTGSVRLEDFDLADLILVIGQNPGSNHPRMLGTLQKAARRGCKIVSINPLKEAGLNHFRHPKEPWAELTDGTPMASAFLRVKINGDVALLKGLAKHILEQGDSIDHDFINAHTHGFDDYKTALQTISWEEIVENSGVPKAEIIHVADWIRQSKRMICCWAMGVTQHPNAVANIQEIVNLMLLGGHMGRPGAGVCPVRGHSNVQGDRTVGINEKPPQAFLDKLGEVFNFTPPQAHGYDTVGAIRAMAAGQGKVFFALGGNFLSATPDTEYTADALRRCELTVQVSTKLNRSHLITGKQALILPCLGRSELDEQDGAAQYVTTENSMSFISRSQGKLKPASEHLRSEPWIVAELAHAVLGERDNISWRELARDYRNIRALIEQVLPGFDNYTQRIDADKGFYLPHPVREREFRTATSKANFTVHSLPTHDLQAGQYIMMTIRTHDQYNTTIYGLDDRYRGVYNGRRVLMMHPEDMKNAGLQTQDKVNITSHFRGETRVAECFVVIPYDIPQGCVATYYPESNVLVPAEHFAEKSHTPASKCLVVSLEKV